MHPEGEDKSPPEPETRGKYTVYFWSGIQIFFVVLILVNLYLPLFRNLDVGRMETWLCTCHLTLWFLFALGCSVPIGLLVLVLPAMDKKDRSIYLTFSSYAMVLLVLGVFVQVITMPHCGRAFGDPETNYLQFTREHSKVLSKLYQAVQKELEIQCASHVDPPACILNHFRNFFKN